MKPGQLNPARLSDSDFSLNRILLMCLFLILFQFGGLAYGDVVYVSGDVSTSGSGASWSQAYKTIQEAIDNAQGGADEIWVKKGTYVQQTTIQVSKPLEVYGGFTGNETRRSDRDPKANETIIDGNNAVTCIKFADVFISGFRLDGFVVTKASGPGIDVQSRFGSSGNLGVIIQNCVFHQNAGYAISSRYTNVTVVNCRIFENGSGINFYSSYASAVNCSIHGNSGRGIQLGLSYKRLSIVNCSIHDNGDYGIYTFNSQTGDPVNIQNCIVWGNAFGGFNSPESASLDITYSNIQDMVTGDGNLNQDPDFADSYGRLSITSPCIDAGTNNSSLLEPEDVEGKTRFLDGDGNGIPSVDMGAFEYGLDLIESEPVVQLFTGDTYRIRWLGTTSEVGELIQLEVSINEGQTWGALAGAASNQGFYDWVVGAAEAGACRIRISSVDQPLIMDEGESMFRVYEDVDADEMGDAWELHYFGQLGNEGSLDQDSDGLTDLVEFNYQTDPTSQDTDHDGLSDGREVNETDPAWSGLMDPLQKIWGYEPVFYADYRIYFPENGTGIATDASNHVHISFHADGDLIYGTNKTGVWQTEAVAQGFDLGLHNAIDVAADGTVHISYYDGAEQILKYAVGSFGKWDSTIVDQNGTVGQYNDIRVDASGKAHICYYDGTDTQLKYATNAEGVWTTEIIDNTGGAGEYGSIGIDTDGRIHVSYFDRSSGRLKYARRVAGDWNIWEIDGAGIVGIETSLAVDKAGKVHIAYHDQTSGALKYASNALGSWRAGFVDKGEPLGLYSAIAVDTAGHVHIAYFDEAKGQLKYALKQQDIWQVKTVFIGDSGPIGDYVSLTLDNSNDVHLIFQSDETPPDYSTGSMLLYANNVPPFSYDLTSDDWYYSTTGNSVAGYPGCRTFKDEKGTVEVTQIGKNVMAIFKDPSGDIPFWGMVSGKKAELEVLFFENPADVIQIPPNTTLYGPGLMRIAMNLEFESASYLKGTLHWHWTFDQQLWCDGKSDVVLSNGAMPNSGGSSGGGGSGCFIDTAAIDVAGY
jgi:hypothetical protein